MRIYKRSYISSTPIIISEYEFEETFKDSWIKSGDALEILKKEKQFCTDFCEYYL